MSAVDRLAAGTGVVRVAFPGMVAFARSDQMKFAALFVAACAGILTVASAVAQPLPPQQPRPGDPKRTIPEKIEPPEKGVPERAPGQEPLSKRLNRSDGVIAPPKNVDPEARMHIAELDAASIPASLQQNAPELVHLTDGLHLTRVGPERARTLVQTRADGSRFVVSQLTAYRDEIARGSALRAVLPIALLIPSLILAVAAIVHVSFRPVTALANSLDSARESLTARLSTSSIPNELHPFIGSINRLLDRIAELFDRQRRFIADAAHELRSPITALSLQAQNLDQASLEGDALERLNALKSGITRTHHLLEQLLALAKSDAASPANFKRLALDRIAADVVADLLPLAEARRHDIGFKAVEPATIDGDSTAIAALVRNLVDNAIRHTPCGSKIDISILHRGQAVILRVEDNGPGIAENEGAGLFEPFARGSQTEADGAGLGLSIVQRVVKQHRGTIVIQNITGAERHGLQVSVSWPSAWPQAL
ncbi:MAG: GHKL domain-containing protein [Proteobacteria bacterium]|nr:GHKL domain-containing protein [Pseudomonadota bacterium]